MSSPRMADSISISASHSIFLIGGLGALLRERSIRIEQTCQLMAKAQTNRLKPPA
jgi:hypothetical protein